MPIKKKTTKNPRINWNKLKTKFMTGNYSSLRDFARKECLNYNGNFHANTKGWVDEKGAKQVQISCKIQEKFMDKEIEKLIEISEKIHKISTLALDAAEEFFTNKDYCRHTFQQYKYKRDKDDKFILNKQGERIKVNTVDLVETPFVRIDKVRHAIETVNKVTRTLRNLGTSLSSINNHSKYPHCHSEYSEESQ